VVLAEGPLEFVREGASSWRHAAPVNTELDLADQLVGWAAVEGSDWLYSRSLYVERA
jgi:hypothetical protein